jgi:hypothetical protein
MRQASTAGTLALLLVSWGLADEPLKSGPQGDRGPPSHLFGIRVTGPHAGGRETILGELRTNPHPAAFVFVRSLRKPVQQLITKLEARALQSKVFVSGVFLRTDRAFPAHLKAWAKKEKISAALLTVVDRPGAARPGGITPEWMIAEKAEITVVLYDRQRRRVANFAFRAGEMQEKDVERIVTAFSKIPTRD